MGFKKYYKQVLKEAPHISLDISIDFEAEKNMVVEKLVRLIKSLEDWQIEDVIKQILNHNKTFPLFVRNELKVLEDNDVNRYKEAINIIPKELR